MMINSPSLLTAFFVVPPTQDPSRIQKSIPMYPRRLNDRILELCKAAIVAPVGTELDLILETLRAALSEQTQRVRSRAMQPIPERRQVDTLEHKPL